MANVPPPPSASTSSSSRWDGFLAGWAYGTMSVLVGQPFETLKTRMQMQTPGQVHQGQSSLSVARDLFRSEGVSGLYRGGTSLFVGGALIRSTQFGVNSFVLQELEARTGGKTRLEDRVLGLIDGKVLLAGLVGGVARGVVEAPFELVKVRRQIDRPWQVMQLWQGSGATIVRNSFLFSSFVIYMDVSKQYVQLSPFWLGSSCASLAWLTIWPLDVVKTQLQSGAAPQGSFFRVLVDVVRSGALFRGLAPGLVRSSISNGCAMMAFKEVERLLQEHRLRAAQG